jgi:hypothetical protein
MPKVRFYTNEQLAATRQLLQEAAARGPRKPERYTRREVCQELHEEFEELRRQGFGNVQIAEIMSQGLGDVLGAPVLQKFFSPTKRRKRKKRDRSTGNQAIKTTSKPKVPLPHSDGAAARHQGKSDHLRGRS